MSVELVDEAARLGQRLQSGPPRQDMEQLVEPPWPQTSEAAGV